MTRPRRPGFANYVEYVNELSPAVAAAATHPDLVAVLTELLGPTCWFNDDSRCGVVYQDSRPGRESGYTRIGWHADWQSAPNLDIWPATAFTFHIDGTSPANGFLPRRTRQPSVGHPGAFPQHQQRARARGLVAHRRLHRG